MAPAARADLVSRLFASAGTSLFAAFTVLERDGSVRVRRGVDRPAG